VDAETKAGKMFFFGFISSIFWAFVLAIILWILCAFSGRLIDLRFRMTFIHHFAMCFVVFLPTVVLLGVVFSCSKANHMVSQFETSIAKVMMVDDQFVDQLHRQIGQTVSTTDTETLTDYLTGNFTKKFLSEYPILNKYTNISNLLEKTDIKKRLSGVLQDKDVADKGNARQLIRIAVDSFSKAIRAKIKSVQRTAFIAFVLLQVIAFGAVLYRANKTISQVTPS
jgi:hypothetical protein